MGLGDAENAVLDPIGLIRKHRLLLPVNLFDVQQVFILATLRKRKGTLIVQRGNTFKVPVQIPELLPYDLPALSLGPLLLLGYRK